MSRLKMWFKRFKQWLANSQQPTSVSSTHVINDEDRARLRRYGEFVREFDRNNNQQVTIHPLAISELSQNRSNNLITPLNDKRRYLKKYFYVDVTLKIDYQDAVLNITQRRVKVNQVQRRGKEDAYYIKGFCYLAGEERTFKVDRIMRCFDADNGRLISDVIAFLIAQDKHKRYLDDHYWWSF